MILLLTAAALGADVLIYTDDNVTGVPSQAEAAAQRVGHATSVWLDDPVGFAAEFYASPPALVIIESIQDHLGGEVEDVIRQGIFDGIPILFSHWDLEVEIALQGELAVTPTAFLVGPPPEIYPTAGDPLGLYAGLPAAIEPAPTDILGDNGDVLSLSRGGVIAAEAAVGPMILATNGGRVHINGFMHVDYRNRDLDFDLVPDVQELLANQIISLIDAAVSQPDLQLDGTCPGTVSLHIDGLTPGGNFALLKANRRGAFTIPATAPCGGTETQLAPAGLKVLGTFRADSAGAFDTSPTIPLLMCLTFIQAVDLSTCETTNISGF